MTNIKNIGKELMGKSLNSFHRKTGLTQLEENNKMQDGILNGILSQVDDAYIEKTEQSNVIHLEGSGDGVVVLDSIEGNTMVNLATVKTITLSGVGSKIISNITRKINTVYTLVFDVTSNTATSESDNGIYLWTTSSATVSSSVKSNVLKGRCVYKMTSTTDVNSAWNMGCRNQLSGIITIDNIMILEGDWTNKEIPPYFEGLQSSFEENITDEGQYKFEILMNNKNLIDNSKSYQSSYASWMPNIGSLNNIVTTDTYNATFGNRGVGFLVKDLKPNTQYTLSIPSLLTNNRLGYALYSDENSIKFWQNHIQGQGDITTNKITFTTPNKKTVAVVGVYGSYEVLYNNGASDGTVTIGNYRKLQLEVGNKNTEFNLQKQNKIKLLINEPLRAIDDIKDRLCVKDGKFVVERNLMEIILDDEKSYGTYSYNNTNTDPIVPFSYLLDTPLVDGIQKVMCNQLPYNSNAIHLRNVVGIASFREDNSGHNALRFGIHKNTLGITDALENKSYISQLISYLKDNPLKVIVKRAEPVYEEVLNEYGEPILLEGYENGTLYVDSVIVPTTTVKYTPKMESFKAIKEVKDNNIMLTNDINDTIVPYMMEVDLMIMEKEVAIMSHKNMRKLGEKDMTSMQKRTQQMLERLIKGRTLTEQECKTRVTTYLNANKITDEQAEELMLLISEVYA